MSSFIDFMFEFKKGKNFLYALSVIAATFIISSSNTAVDTYIFSSHDSAITGSGHSFQLQFFQVVLNCYFTGSLTLHTRTITAAICCFLRTFAFKFAEDDLLFPGPETVLRTIRRARIIQRDHKFIRDRVTQLQRATHEPEKTIAALVVELVEVLKEKIMYWKADEEARVKEWAEDRAEISEILKSVRKTRELVGRRLDKGEEEFQYWSKARKEGEQKRGKLNKEYQAYTVWKKQLLKEITDFKTLREDVKKQGASYKRLSGQAANEVAEIKRSLNEREQKVKERERRLAKEDVLGKKLWVCSGEVEAEADQSTRRAD